MSCPTTPPRLSFPTSVESPDPPRFWNDPRRLHLARETLKRSRCRIARERRGLLKAVPIPALIALIEAILPLIAQIFELIERVFQADGESIAHGPDSPITPRFPSAAALDAASVADLDPELVRALGDVLARPNSNDHWEERHGDSTETVAVVGRDRVGSGAGSGSRRNRRRTKRNR